MIALVDYGAGNLTSVRKALGAVGGEFFTPAAPDEMRRATGVILPGVGHFAATRSLTAAWRAEILDAVERRVPLLGICLGMQYLFEGSDEAADVPGLSLFQGRCTRLPAHVKVPHVGWNEIAIVRPSRLLAGVPHGSTAYFTHSYAAPVTAMTVAATEHGARFAAVVEREHVFGAQFHPEKSSGTGLAILRAFVAIAGLGDIEPSPQQCSRSA